MFCRIVSLGDPNRRVLMILWECTSTRYVLCCIVVVPTSDPRDIFMEHVTMFTAQRIWLIWVELVE
jgi:hypothetical protein